MNNENQFNDLSIRSIVKKEYIENDQTLCFDSIPIYKVIILLFVTIGFYSVVLFYNWWKKLKTDFGYKVSPFWRGLFNGISVFWLFPIFEKYFKCYNISLPSGIYATLYFGCVWACNQLSYHNTSMITEIGSWLFLFGAIAIIVNIQIKINTINKHHYLQAKKNDWKLSNTIWTIICSSILVLSMLP